MQPADSDPLLESDAFKMFCFKVRMQRVSNDS